MTCAAFPYTFLLFFSFLLTVSQSSDIILPDMDIKNVQVSAMLHSELRAYCQREGRSMAWVVAKALEGYIAGGEPAETLDAVIGEVLGAERKTTKADGRSGTEGLGKDRADAGDGGGVFDAGVPPALGFSDGVEVGERGGGAGSEVDQEGSGVPRNAHAANREKRGTPGKGLIAIGDVAKPDFLRKMERDLARGKK